MWLEIPDAELRIDGPSSAQILAALSALDCGPTSDSCIEICLDDTTYMQAIGCQNEGFKIEFQEGSVMHHFRSRDTLSLEVTDQILQRYLSGDDTWRQCFIYEPFSVASRVAEA
jgi:hypothetical protein